MKQKKQKGQIETLNHFGIPIYSILVKNFEIHQQALIDYFLEMRKTDKGVHKSNVNGWHSKENLFKDTNEHVQWMTKKIENIALTAAKHFHGESRTGKPELAALWANISDSGCWNAPHQHLPADWSGVFYLSAESDQEPGANGVTDGDLMFINPLPMGPRFDRATSISYKPVNGKMLIFPAYATHMVAPHYQILPRISISFNLFWKK
jgi:uncharacterized protein (TIGR02466 family)